MLSCASSYWCFVVTCWERADILTLVCDVVLWVYYFPIGILSQVWYLFVSIPDLCSLSYLAVDWGNLIFAGTMVDKLCEFLFVTGPSLITCTYSIRSFMLWPGSFHSIFNINSIISSYIYYYRIIKHFSYMWLLSACKGTNARKSHTHNM